MKNVTNWNEAIQSYKEHFDQLLGIYGCENYEELKDEVDLVFPHEDIPKYNRSHPKGVVYLPRDELLMTQDGSSPMRITRGVAHDGRN